MYSPYILLDKLFKSRAFEMIHSPCCLSVPVFHAVQRDGDKAYVR